eukprot:XP_001708596.1 Hypothetical protein GL50803_36386 [Giardia lamblia ATCC 50803]
MADAHMLAGIQLYILWSVKTHYAFWATPKKACADYLIL